MPDLTKTQLHIRTFDELSKRDVGLNSLHPVIQVVVTFVYLVVIVSYPAAEISGLLPLILYPAVLMIINEVPLKPVLVRLAFALPFILGIGILNPLFDHQPIIIGEFTVTRGWLVFLSIFLKGILTVLAALLLIAACGLARIAKSLRILRVPKFLVLQLLLTYRYLTVLLDEVARTVTAYSLRAPGQRGIGFRAWGPLLGQLFLRTFDRAERIYQAMRLRGFEGDYPDEPVKKIKPAEILYGLLWTGYFLLARWVDIPQFLGGLL